MSNETYIENGGMNEKPRDVEKIKSYQYSFDECGEYFTLEVIRQFIQSINIRINFFGRQYQISVEDKNRYIVTDPDTGRQYATLLIEHNRILAFGSAYGPEWWNGFLKLFKRNNFVSFSEITSDLKARNTDRPLPPDVSEDFEIPIDIDVNLEEVDPFQLSADQNIALYQLLIWLHSQTIKAEKSIKFPKNKEQIHIKSGEETYRIERIDSGNSEIHLSFIAFQDSFDLILDFDSDKQSWMIKTYHPANSEVIEKFKSILNKPRSILC